MNCFSLPHEPIPAPPMFCGDSQAEDDEEEENIEIYRLSGRVEEKKVPFSRSQSYSEGCITRQTNSPGRVQQAHSHLALLDETEVGLQQQFLNNKIINKDPYSTTQFVNKNGFIGHNHFHDQTNPNNNTNKTVFNLEKCDKNEEGEHHSCLQTLETVVAVQQEQISVLRNTLKELAATYTRREQSLLAKIVALQRDSLIQPPAQCPPPVPQHKKVML